MSDFCYTALVFGGLKNNFIWTTDTKGQNTWFMIDLKKKKKNTGCVVVERLLRYKLFLQTAACQGSSVTYSVIVMSTKSMAEWKKKKIV